MNYANMIEEKNLKKTFIIATLCSTLVGTFTSSMGLWDRVNEKRRQSKRDVKQDEEIKKLRDQVEKAEQRSKDRDEEARRKDDRLQRRDEFGSSLERSGALIQREFDDGYGMLGRRFAVGDQLTENKLQAQIIALQQTVINVLQDALYSDRQLTRTDMNKLMSAAAAAREGSLDALRQQRDRLNIEEPRALPPPKRSSTIIESDPLFCRYSLDLQYIPHKPLAASFAPDGDNRCPACGVRLHVDSSDFWQIGKRTPVFIPDGRGYEKEVIEDREFHLGQRFIVKCHTADGEYACVLCNEHRERDAICRTVESLVNHVGRFHDISELEKEVDLREKMMPAALPALPPPPPPPAPLPPARDDYREIVEERRVSVPANTYR